MSLKSIHIKNFRCFDNFKLDIDNKIVLIEGQNGIGKTSLLESLYYLCYLRSFKTRITKELINHSKEEFFLKVEFEDNNFLTREIQAGFSENKRSIKIDKKNAKSYKDLLDTFKVVALTEDDLTLIKGSPEKRRTFLDHYALLMNPELIKVFKNYKKIVDNKNALFKSLKLDLDSYEVWTKQLWQISQEIREVRINVLKRLKEKVAVLYKENFNEDIEIDFQYQFKNGSLEDKTYDQFSLKYSKIINQEKLYKKSLFGAHFDDFNILWNANSAKVFSSRGQQKLLIVLLKIIQVQENISQNSFAAFLLDDFLTDFDEKRLKILINLICSLNCQVIFTCPVEDSPIKKYLSEKNSRLVKI